MTVVESYRVFAPEERKAELARQVNLGVYRGRRVESQADFTAVLVRGRRPNHVLHLILTLVTFGFWAPVWILLAVFGGEKRELVEVDEYGWTSVQKV